MNPLEVQLLMQFPFLQSMPEQLRSLWISSLLSSQQEPVKYWRGLEHGTDAYIRLVSQLSNLPEGDPKALQTIEAIKGLDSSLRKGTWSVKEGRQRSLWIPSPEGGKFRDFSKWTEDPVLRKLVKKAVHTRTKEPERIWERIRTYGDIAYHPRRKNPFPREYINALAMIAGRSAKDPYAKEGLERLQKIKEVYPEIPIPMPWKEGKTFSGMEDLFRVGSGAQWKVRRAFHPLLNSRRRQKLLEHVSKVGEFVGLPEKGKSYAAPLPKEKWKLPPTGWQAKGHAYADLIKILSGRKTRDPIAAMAISNIHTMGFPDAVIKEVKGGRYANIKFKKPDVEKDLAKVLRVHSRDPLAALGHLKELVDIEEGTNEEYSLREPKATWYLKNLIALSQRGWSQSKEDKMRWRLPHAWIPERNARGEYPKFREVVPAEAFRQAQILLRKNTSEERREQAVQKLKELLLPSPDQDRIAPETYGYRPKWHEYHRMVSFLQGMSHDDPKAIEMCRKIEEMFGTEAVPLPDDRTKKFPEVDTSRVTKALAHAIRSRAPAEKKKGVWARIKQKMIKTIGYEPMGSIVRGGPPPSADPYKKGFESLLESMEVALPHAPGQVPRKLGKIVPGWGGSWGSSVIGPGQYHPEDVKIGEGFHIAKFKSREAMLAYADGVAEGMTNPNPPPPQQQQQPFWRKKKKWDLGRILRLEPVATALRGMTREALSRLNTYVPLPKVTVDKTPVNPRGYFKGFSGRSNLELQLMKNRLEHMAAREGMDTARREELRKHISRLDIELNARKNTAPSYGPYF